jgi:hypothetical protein
MKKMNKKYTLLMLVAISSMFVFGQGCFFVAPPGGGGTVGVDGDLRVEWSFDGGFGCPADVQDVVIEIRNGAGAKVIDDVIVACGAGTRTIPSLPIGDYFVHVKGLDIDDSISWESGEQRIPVESDATAVTTVDLLPAD